MPSTKAGTPPKEDPKDRAPAAPTLDDVPEVSDAELEAIGDPPESTISQLLSFLKELTPEERAQVAAELGVAAPPPAPVTLPPAPLPLPSPSGATFVNTWSSRHQQFLPGSGRVLQFREVTIDRGDGGGEKKIGYYRADPGEAAELRALIVAGHAPGIREDSGLDLADCPTCGYMAVPTQGRPAAAVLDDHRANARH